jgi:hypothetical protein
MTARQGYMIGPQVAIEVTTDEYGDVTLRQGDASITVSANNLATLIEILIWIDNDRSSLDDSPIDDGPPDDDDTIAAPPTAPLSNAERQRRYREQHRNETVTKRNGDRNANRNGGSP